ncbi:MAG: amidohydrolase family protein [Candidatus Bathyarchaeota archaeon]|nr:amidohydrolase family protein [Candidatus Bathyarchaeota archaeon]
MIVDIHAHIGHHPLMDFKQTPEEILSAMDRFGIDVTFVMPFPSMKIQTVNDAVAEAVKNNPGRLVGFACIDPMADGAPDEIERIVGLGLKGVMLDPEFHRVFGRDAPHPKVEELMVPCMDQGLPVLFNTPNIETADHASFIVGGISEPYYKSLDQLAFKFPDVRLVVNPHWHRIRDLMKEHSNIFVDTGGRNGIGSGVRLAQDASPTRVCFGSESPQNHPGLGIKNVRTIKVSQVYKDLVLGRNAERIFRDLL